MAIVLGLIVAITYGSGDFFGGLAAKRSPTATVVIGSFGVSAILLVAVTAGWALVGDLPDPAQRDVVLGVGAGLIGPVALACLYRGLAAGRMSVVAPITAVVAAVVPFAWGLVRGERPPVVALVGVGLAIVAVGLISGAPGPTTDVPPEGDEPVPPAHASTREVIPGALLSGLGFGIIFVLLGSTTDEAGLWPLVAARLVAVAVTCVAVAVWVRRREEPVWPQVWAAPGSWRLVMATGVLDISANAIFLAATRRGLLSIVSVLSSLYPASTVVLARIVLHERLHRIQTAGLALATIGVVAMAAG